MRHEASLESGYWVARVLEIDPRQPRRPAASARRVARSIVDWCASIADRPRAIDRYIDYFGGA